MMSSGARDREKDFEKRLEAFEEIFGYIFETGTSDGRVAELLNCLSQLLEEEDDDYYDQFKRSFHTSPLHREDHLSGRFLDLLSKRPTELEDCLCSILIYGQVFFRTVIALPPIYHFPLSHYIIHFV